MRKIITLFVVAFGLISLAGCAGSTTYWQSKGLDIDIVFELQGAVYRQKGTQLTFKVKKNSLLRDPMILLRNDIDYVNHSFEGWFKEEECITPWRFEVDKADEDITLYAKWTKNTVYSYQIVTVINGVETVIQNITVSEYAKLYRNGINRSGYTLLEIYEDKDHVKTWDPNFTHPSGEEEVVKVYTEWIEGSFRIVRTLADLENALIFRDNIYLLSDIDGNTATGKTVWTAYSITRTETDPFIFAGNGHVIKNFKVQYSEERNTPTHVGLFSKVNYGEIKDVTFEGIDYELSDRGNSVRIYFGPIVGVVDGGSFTFSNIRISGELIIKNSTKEIDYTVTEPYSYNNNSLVNIENVVIDVTVNDERS